MSRDGAEKACVKAGVCSLQQFRTRSENKRWTKDGYKACYTAILSEFDIEDDRRKHNRRSLVAFLNGESAGQELGVAAGVKRRASCDHSYAEGESDGEGDVSMTSISLDEPEEVLVLKRALTDAKLEIRG